MDIPLVEVKTMYQPLKQSGDNMRNTKKSRISRFSHLSVHDLKSTLFFIRESWKSGLAANLLTMPFALNAGNNSGCNGSIGLTTAFIASIVNGLFSGSNHSFYVPNQMATIFLYQISQQYGVEAIPWVTLIIGITIYLTYLLRWHHLIEFMPGFVREGYFLGLYIIVFNTYVDYAFGLSDLHSNRGFPVYQSKYDMYVSYFQRGDLKYFCASISVYLFLYFGNKICKPMPWVLVSSCFGMAYSVVYPNERCLRSVYGQTSLHFSLLEISGPQFVLDLRTLQDLIVQATPMAIYILVQNLICAKGAETLTGVKCDLDQETQCVSIANIVSGLFGGLPCNCQQRLYVLNIQVRETNQWSSMINACSAIIFFQIFGRQFMEMPLFIVGGQVMYSAYQCPTWSYVDRIIETRRYLTIFKCAVMAMLSVYYGALPAAVMGSLYSLLKFAETMSAAASEIVFHGKSTQRLRQSMTRQLDGEDENREQLIEHNEDTLEIENEGYILYRFNGSINYINVKNHVEQIKRLPECDIIAFSFRYVSVFDEQALDRLCIVMENLIKCGREIYFTGLHPSMIVEMKYNKFFREFIEFCPEKLRFLN